MGNMKKIKMPTIQEEPSFKPTPGDLQIQTTIPIRLPSEKSPKSSKSKLHRFKSRLVNLFPDKDKDKSKNSPPPSIISISQPTLLLPSPPTPILTPPTPQPESASPGCESPTGSFYTCPSYSSSSTSISSITAAYRFSSPTIFWDVITRRGQRSAILDEKRRREEEERRLSLGERIRRERFKRPSNSSQSAEETQTAQEVVEEQPITTIPQAIWQQELERRYYGDEEDEDVFYDADEELGDEEEGYYASYWRRVEELRKAVATAIADVALRPMDWRKMVD
ncbi:hypothetical protein TWF694_001350 [Orbilia ellipsospora]|uniref:Uncharacterized protein n=1 Tax=Orbilia ellipsospora TaxID=2528407 RepID=A0AAV9XSY6_9PEZI